MHWLIQLLHCFNIVLALINLSGLDEKVYTANSACYITLFEMVMLTWMQISYFKGQDNQCIKVPDLYFLLMAEIPFLYLGIIAVLMYVFRKLFRPENEIDIDGFEKEGENNDSE